MSEQVWTEIEVLAHLRKVFKHFGLEGKASLTASELVDYLERYDEVEPITADQVAVVGRVLIRSLDHLERKRIARSN